MGARSASGEIPAALLARLDDLWFENFAGWARAHPLGRVEVVDGWRIASLGSPWPFYNIATVVEGQDPDPSRLRSAFSEVGGYRVWLRDGMEAAESKLRAAGFSCELELPAYLAHLRPPGGGGGGATRPADVDIDAAGPPGYQLSRARDREEIDELVWGDRWSPWTGVDDVAVTFPDPSAMAGSADRRFYQARQAGRLVATGQSLLHAGVLGIYGMWTAEAHRGRGLATALLQRILRDGVKAGAEYATLQAAEPGGGLYTVAGFRRRYAYRVYRDRL